MSSNSAPVVDRIRIIPRPDDFLDRNVGASGEVFFDKQRSVMETRILGIAPLQEVYDDQDNFKYEKPMFWVYYPELRDVLARKEALVLTTCPIRSSSPILIISPPYFPALGPISIT